MRGGEEGLLPSVNILRFHRSTLASTIQTTFSKVSTDLIPAAPLWLRDTSPTNFETIWRRLWTDTKRHRLSSSSRPAEVLRTPGAILTVPRAQVETFDKSQSSDEMT
jgi:hypothetical protein